METVATQNEDVVPHSVPLCIFLHLIPGFSALPFHLLIVGSVTDLGWPVAMSWHVATSILCFIPIMMGILLYEAKKRGNTGFSLKGVVMYRRKLSIRAYFGWAVAILLMTAPIFSLLQPVTDYLSTWFEWLPKTDNNYEGEFPVAIIAVTFAFNVLITGFAVPVVEELYYRGYLLPRMPTAFGKAGPIVHSALFAIHHPQSAWMVIVRTIGLLPLIYVTRRTRSLVPAMFAHCAVNTSDAVGSAFSTLD